MDKTKKVSPFAGYGITFHVKAISVAPLPKRHAMQTAADFRNPFLVNGSLLMVYLLLSDIIA